ncbi:MAG: hypothetical protein M1820_009655 [Bogoriella megaspora]|nr:MAG: hypothetical protein M1820_009655 [Bogoriella megaspora]
MAILWTLPARITQVVFAIIVLGLTAYVANWWNRWYHHMSPSEINFLIFSSVWSLLALAYLVLAPWRFPDAAHKFAVLAVEGVTMIFWFAGFVSAAVFLSNRACYGRVCNVAKAGTAFAAFEWPVGGMNRVKGAE